MESRIIIDIENFIKWVIPLLLVLCLAFSHCIMWNLSDHLSAGCMSTYQGNNERFGMIAYILSQLERWLMGFGIGNFKWTTPYAFGFIHYG